MLFFFFGLVLEDESRLKRKGNTWDICLPGCQAIVKRILAARSQRNQYLSFGPSKGRRMGNLKYFWLQQSVWWDVGCCTDAIICVDDSNLVKESTVSSLVSWSRLCVGALAWAERIRGNFVLFWSFTLSPLVKWKSHRSFPQFLPRPFLCTNRNSVWYLLVYLCYTNNIISTLVFSTYCFHSFLCCCNLSMLQFILTAVCIVVHHVNAMYLLPYISILWILAISNHMALSLFLWLPL